jgi:uncharacterized membrane protein
MPLYLVSYLLRAVPLVLGKAPPNRFCGFRTRKTLSSPAIWYPANRIAGWLLIAGSAVASCFNVGLWSLHPEWPQETLLRWIAGAA